MLTGCNIREKRVLAWLVAMVAFCAVANGQVVVNEVMQSNIDCVMDAQNEFPDSWVELYNGGTEAVNLAEYSVGVTDNPDEAWPLPQQSIAPKGYCLVYCDKEGKDMHTDFRLESGKGCTLFVFKNGQIVDCLPTGMKKQPAPNVAFGRKTDGGDEWGYQLVATPGATNCGELCGHGDVLGEPVFSVEGRVFMGNEAVSVVLSLPDGCPEGTVIRYTDDGSEPTEASQQYRDAISVSGTKVIRAKLFCEGYLSPRSTTHSYIQMNRDVTLPVVSIVTDSRYLYDNKIGIYVDGTYSSRKNYEYNWRRPINFEYFSNDDLEASSINQLCEARVTGGASRASALKSLGLYAHKRFGKKRFGYEFFPDQRPGITDYKSIMLRNAGNDFDYLYMRDAVIQRTMAESTDIDWQAWSPVIVFMNGEYKGILNIRERSNDNNVYSNYDGLEDIDMVENWWDLKEGRWDAWNDFKAFYNEHGHTWDEYSERMDVEEFINIMIMNLFFCNLDFPGNNIVFWRPQADGGRWRVIAKDTDFGLGLYDRTPDYKMLEWLYNPNYDSSNAWANGYEHTRLFRRLMEDERFSREFIDRFAIYIGDFLNYDRVWEIWGAMYEKIKAEYPVHRALFNRWWPNYAQELNKAQAWLRNRVPRMYDQISDFYDVGTPKMLSVNASMPQDELDGIAVAINGVRLTRGKFGGKFFAGREIVLEGENVAGWEITEIRPDGPSKKTVAGDTYIFAIPETSTGVIVEAKVDATGIADNIMADAEQPTAIYDAMGVRRTSLGRGINIVRTARGAVKVMKK